MRLPSCRGPRPASKSSPKPSTSRRLALPELPLASTVKRTDMGTSSCSLETANRFFLPFWPWSFPEQVPIHGELAATEEQEGKARHNNDDVVLKSDQAEPARTVASSVSDEVNGARLDDDDPQSRQPR